MIGLSVLKAFVQEEVGAASIDWIVISAACVGLGLAVTNVVVTELVGLSNQMNSQFHADLTSNPFQSNHDPIEPVCMYEDCIGVDPVEAAEGTDHGDADEVAEDPDANPLLQDAN